MSSEYLCHSNLPRAFLSISSVELPPAATGHRDPAKSATSWGRFPDHIAPGDVSRDRLAHEMLAGLLQTSEVFGKSLIVQ